MPFHILYLTKNPVANNIVNRTLANEGHHIENAVSFNEAENLLRNKQFDCLLSDFELHDGNLKPFLQSKKNKIPACIVLCNTDNFEEALTCFPLGATHYLLQPIKPFELLKLVNHLSSPSKSAAFSNDYTLNASLFESQFVKGNSLQSAQIMELVDLTAPTDLSVLISGESGTGKEFIAKQIHLKSTRKNQPFIAIDCGGLSNREADLELFGRVSKDPLIEPSTGQFERATGGTLFLDEIGNLNYQVQVKLLRAIQEKVIRKVGGSGNIPINVRIITASNFSLPDLIQSGKFREDLYYRINEFGIDLKPIRTRKLEILQYAKHFISEANTLFNKNVLGYSQEVEKILTNYRWPGNLRELHNIINRVVLICQTDKIQTHDLPKDLVDQSLVWGIDEQNTSTSTDLKKLEGQLEREKIMEVLELTRYNKSKAAKMLNIDRKTLYNKIKNYHLKI